MNEEEIQEKLDEYRSFVEENRKKINGLISEARDHQKDISHLRKERDRGNDRCKELSIKAKQMREKRDALNNEIAQLKSQRKELNDKIKNMSSAIKGHKEKRDELNREARGTDQSLVQRYGKDMDSLLNKDISLDREIKLFNNIFQLQDRVEAAKEATEFHKKVISTYDGIKEYDDLADKLSDKIRQLADESEKYHLKAIEIYSQVDKIRGEADQCHERLLEKYKIVSPIRDKITAIKKEMESRQEKMLPHLGQMDKLNLGKDVERRAQKAADAKKKLKDSGRISLDDLKALMDSSEEDKLMDELSGESEIEGFGGEKKSGESLAKKELKEPESQKQVGAGENPKQIVEPEKPLELQSLEQKESGGSKDE